MSEAIGLFLTAPGSSHIQLVVKAKYRSIPRTFKQHYLGTLLHSFELYKQSAIYPADDLFVSIVGMPYLEVRFREWFVKPEFRQIGGILFLRPSGSLNQKQALIRFEENQFSENGNILPGNAVEHLKAQADIDDNRRLEKMSSVGPLSRAK
jgi:hypothetical protein